MYNFIVLYANLIFWTFVLSFIGASISISFSSTSFEQCTNATNSALNMIICITIRMIYTKSHKLSYLNLIEIVCGYIYERSIQVNCLPTNETVFVKCILTYSIWNEMQLVQFLCGFYRQNMDGNEFCDDFHLLLLIDRSFLLIHM